VGLGWGGGWGLLGGVWVCLVIPGFTHENSIESLNVDTSMQVRFEMSRGRRGGADRVSREWELTIGGSHE